MSTQTSYSWRGSNKPTVFWMVITPEGDDTGHEHSRIGDVISELMCIDSVSDEVYDRLRGQAQYDWTQEDKQDWIWQNCAPIAKELGYRINKIIR